LNFYRHIFEKFSSIKFHEILSLGSELFHAVERTQTDMTKVIVFFPILRKRLKYQWCRVRRILTHFHSKHAAC